MKGVLEVKPHELREECDVDGTNFYILSFDQSSHIKVSTRGMEIIRLLDGKKDKDEIIKSLYNKGINITLEEFDYFIKEFLIPKNILVGSSNQDKIQKNKTKLWLHLPIIESTKFQYLYRLLKYLFHKKAIVIGVMILVLGCLLTSIYEVIHSSQGILGGMNSLLVLFLIYISMFIHELGHITAAYKYGIQVGKIGIGIYLAYFVFFVDMTNAWKLDRNKRIVTDLGGMYFQLITIIPIYITYIFINNISLLYAIIVIFFTTLMNLIPFLRMDGYWLLTDYLNIQNIQIKAFYSIRQLYIALKRKKRDSQFEINKSTYVYGIYSIVYVIATTLLIVSLLYSFIDVIINYESLISKLIIAYGHLRTGKISEFLMDINNLFIVLIPIIFIVSLILSFGKGMYQRVTGGKQNS